MREPPGSRQGAPRRRPRWRSSSALRSTVADWSHAGSSRDPLLVLRHSSYLVVGPGIPVGVDATEPAPAVEEGAPVVDPACESAVGATGAMVEGTSASREFAMSRFPLAPITLPAPAFAAWGEPSTAPFARFR